MSKGWTVRWAGQVWKAKQKFPLWACGEGQLMLGTRTIWSGVLFFARWISGELSVRVETILARLLQGWVLMANSNFIEVPFNGTCIHKLHLLTETFLSSQSQVQFTNGVNAQSSSLNEKCSSRDTLQKKSLMNHKDTWKAVKWSWWSKNYLLSFKRGSMKKFLFVSKQNCSPSKGPERLWL